MAWTRFGARSDGGAHVDAAGDEGIGATGPQHVVDHARPPEGPVVIPQGLGLAVAPSVVADDVGHLLGNRPVEQTQLVLVGPRTGQPVGPDQRAAAHLRPDLGVGPCLM